MRMIGQFFLLDKYNNFLYTFGKAVLQSLSRLLLAKTKEEPENTRNISNKIVICKSFLFTYLTLTVFFLLLLYYL